MMIEHSDKILSEQISGFHQYRLVEPFELSFVSRNLCRMLMVEDLNAEDYAQMVYPADRERYEEFLQNLARGRETATLQYRLIRSDGQTITVSDTVHTDRAEDGTLFGSSVLTDITELKAENQDLHFLNDTIPCGFIKYTCEKQPKITYINDRMLSILRFPSDREERQDLLEFYMENLYALIPMEERSRMGQYLDRVYSSGVPLVGEITVLRCDGTRARLFGWVIKIVDEQGREEFQSVCLDISQQHLSKKAAQISRYLGALHDVYDKIFEYDFTAGTVTCLYGQNSAMFRHIEHIPMQMQEATEKWVRDTVAPDDQEDVMAFFRAFFRHRQAVGQPPQIRYRARSSDGTWKRYLGLFLEIDSSMSLFCCRNLANSRESAALESENASLKSINENMQELIHHFTDGLAAFELNGDLVTPLYASDNVCSFFGYTREEWLELMKQKTPSAQFVRRSAIPYEEFARIFDRGQVEFTYPDLRSGTRRRIRAVCSQKGPGDGTRYVMLYDMDAAPRVGPEVVIRTFGYFDVFVDGRPIAFRIQKAKELFALLVDRRGGYVTSDEAISYLWPEEPSSPVTLARYRKVALRLKSILEEYGIPQVVESVDGKRRIVADRVKCDLYDYLSGRPEHAQLFKGSYLTNYSWGENTLGELTGEILY